MIVSITVSTGIGGGGGGAGESVDGISPAKVATESAHARAIAIKERLISYILP